MIAISEFLNLARADINSGRLAEAKSICDIILRLRPDIADAYYILGIERSRNGSFDEAEKALKEAIKISGENRVLADALAGVMLAAGRWADWLEERRVYYQTNALVLRYLEMDIAYTCNLTCTGCSHYSNYSKKGIVDFEIGSQWMYEWSQRVVPVTFRLLGGEPTLNPRLCDYIRLAAELWPKSIRAVVSNGFFVDRHPDLYRTLLETGTTLDISIHEDSEQYHKNAHLEEIKAASITYGFQLTYSNQPSSGFKRTYRGAEKEIAPFTDNNPEKSFQHCVGPICTFLSEGLLWKCAPIALLGTIQDQLNLSENPLWKPYLSHRGLGTQATDAEIMQYILGAHQICGMCPSC